MFRQSRLPRTPAKRSHSLKGDEERKSRSDFYHRNIDKILRLDEARKGGKNRRSFVLVCIPPVCFRGGADEEQINAVYRNGNEELTQSHEWKDVIRKAFSSQGSFLSVGQRGELRVLASLPLQRPLEYFGSRNLSQ
ncbi:hypothetical protein FOPE_01460 [Fonsecaea pedrosoi]|nr:hypothetical protein FOPE_01460 [Fonsecaea pedrosoi]